MVNSDRLLGFLFCNKVAIVCIMLRYQEIQQSMH